MSKEAMPYPSAPPGYDQPPEQPPAYSPVDTGYYEQQQKLSAHSAAAQPPPMPVTSYPQQQYTPVSTTQTYPVGGVSPNQIVIQTPAGINGRHITVTPNAQSGATSTVIVQQPMTVAPLDAHMTMQRVQASALPVFGTCPSCNQAMSTHTMRQCGAYACMWSLLLTVLGLGLCACIPCCMDTCQDVSHRCPHCGRHIGTYQRLKL